MAQIEIDPFKCNGCGNCIRACDRAVLELDESKQVVMIKRRNICLFCLDCLVGCENEAIYVTE